MKFYIPDNVIRWLGPAAIIAIGAFIIIGNPIGQKMFCEQPQNCLATWVGALSGWAAAAAAAITIRSLYRQADAAQRQTDFMIGDAPPTIDAVQHKAFPEQAVVIIRNWNRRSMIVRSLHLTGAHGITSMYFSFKKEFLQRQDLGDDEKFWKFAFSEEQVFDPAMTLEGWVNREDQPKVAKFGVQAMRGNSDRIDAEWSHILIEITYELVGSAGEHRLAAKVHIATSAVRIDEEILKDVADLV